MDRLIRIKDNANYHSKKKGRIGLGTQPDNPAPEPQPIILALERRYCLKINIPSYLEDCERLPEIESLSLHPNYENSHSHNFQDNIFNNNGSEPKYFGYDGEVLYKSFPGILGHMNGKPKDVVITLSSHALYVVSPPIPENDLLLKMPYEDIDLVIIGSFERWLSIIRKRFPSANSLIPSDDFCLQIDIIDSKITLNLVCYLELAIRRRIQTLLLKNEIKMFVMPSSSNHKYTNANVTKGILSKRVNLFVGQIIDMFIPCVLSFLEEETGYIEKYLASSQLLKSDCKLVHCWFVFWENGNDVSEGQTQDLLPHMEGHLMTNWNAQPTWSPAYFILKNGILYHFVESSDLLPCSVVDLSECCGCSRLPAGVRPYSFQILRQNKPSILLAAPNEKSVSLWLQTILSFLCSKEEYKEKRKLVPCQLIQTSSGLLLTYQSPVVQWNILKKIQKNQNEAETCDSFCFINDNSLINNLNIGQQYVCQAKRPANNEKCTSSQESEKILEFSQDNALDMPVDADPKNVHQIDLDKEKSCLKILSSSSYDQISNIMVERKSKAVYVEFECSEANEMAFDWALYFLSEENLKNFLSNLREDSGDAEFEISFISVGCIAQFLQEGAQSIGRRNPH